MEHVIGNDIDVVREYRAEDRVRNIVLYRGDVVVDVDLAAADVARETAHAVVHEHDIGVEVVDQMIEGEQRRNHAAGRNVDVDAEGRNAGLRVGFRVGVRRNVAFVKMRDIVAAGVVERMVALIDEHRHAGTPRIVVLRGNVDDLGLDYVRHPLKDAPEFF